MLKGFQLQGGALPLDPAGGSAPRPPLQARALRARHASVLLTLNLKIGTAYCFTVSVFLYGIIFYKGVTQFQLIAREAGNQLVCIYRTFMFSQILQPRLSWTIVLWRTQQFLVARKTESVIATDHELSVGLSSKDPVRNRQNFFVHIVWSYSKR